MLTTDSVATDRTGSVRSGGRGPRDRDRRLAAGLGLLTALLSVVFPFLPVVQNTASVTWPTATSGTAPLTAPLVAYRPEKLEVSIGCDAIRSLDDRTPGLAQVWSTVPPNAPYGDTVGMSAEVADGKLTLDNRGQRVGEVAVPPPGGPCEALTVASDGTSTTATFDGQKLLSFDGDARPQITGVYSQLDGNLDPMAGSSVRFDTDNRYDSSATWLKTICGALALAALAGCLFFLRRSDDVDARRILHDRRRLSVRLRGRDVVRDTGVVVVLVVWALIGSMTSDDGYILAISRGSESAGYLGNYYRWFDVPEAPFGWFYQAYSLWSGVSEVVLWLRIPALVMGIASWFLISRALLPRLGTRVRRSRSAAWAAAGVFLCYWLPFDNGLRPESVVVIAALLSFVTLERALATRRLLPVAVALIAAAFAVAATPTGLIALAPFLAAARPLLKLLSERAKRSGWLTTLAPLAGAGLIVLLAIFGDQTWSTISEATRVRTEIGPNMPWSQELYRYQQLFSDSRDGPLQRRFPVLLTWLCTAVAAVVLLRRGRIPGAALGFSRRLLGSTVLSFMVLALTPTKWTHHFGAFAALGAGVAALAALATGTGVLRSRRNQSLFLGAVLAVTALAFTGPNTWWYVSNWGVPWFDKPVSIKGYSATMLLLGAAGIALLIGIVEHLRTPDIPRPVVDTTRNGHDGAVPARRRRLSQAQAVRLGSAPLAVICAAMVLFQVASLAKGMEKQAGSYSLGADILTDPTGSRCGLAGRLMVETDPQAGVLPPATTPPPADAEPEVAEGFSPEGLPPVGAGSLRDNDGDGDHLAGVTGTGPLGGPVTGSWSRDANAIGDYRSGWYALPQAARDGSAPLVLGIAGSVGGGNSVKLQFAKDGKVVETVSPGGGAAGTVPQTADAAGTATTGRAWRDLRLDLSGRAAAQADSVRVVASDRSLGPNSWIAVAQPRVPKLTPLTDLTAGKAGYLDWPTAFVHPCLKRFEVNRNIGEQPSFRLLADPQQRSVGDGWGMPKGGGPQGWINLISAQRVVPTYLPGAWDYDWGQFRTYEPYVPDAVTAPRVDGTRTMWGWQRVGQAGDSPPDPPALPG
ncbi:arabinosyltransferase domain-containing protein [Pseudonocardia phyllosphaerae]|uniref:arabinosyltransferase domain-containing protein n=1 Tax=Pseudonocardia phyllosphaerae TaxID=3390502 RepID=UPI0039780FB0